MIDATSSEGEGLKKTRKAKANPGRGRLRAQIASLVELPEDDPENDEILGRVLSRMGGTTGSLVLTPADVTTSSKARVWWLCPECGTEWKARVCDRLAGQGCPECGHCSVEAVR